MTQQLQRAAGGLDRINRGLGSCIRWLALAMLLVQFGAVVLRYVFGTNSIFVNETVLYFNAAFFMLGAGYTLLLDGHVRVDIFYGSATRRRKAWTDLIGTLVFLFPAMGALAWYTWGSTVNSWAILEGAISVGGVPASFLLKSLIPAFCLLLVVQGAALCLRCLAVILGGAEERDEA